MPQEELTRRNVVDVAGSDELADPRVGFGYVVDFGALISLYAAHYN